MGRNRTYRKKKSNKKYDVIQNIKSNVIEFKKVDYAMFARKLNKMYRIKVIGLKNKNESKMKSFINDHFNANYKFEREENKKSEKFKKYVRNRTYQKKKSNKKYDVIQ